MGYDRLGRPMIVQQYRDLHTNEAVKITTVERMAELHAREQELLLRTVRRRTLDGSTVEGEKKSHIVDSVVVVVDTGGLTLRHVSELEVTLDECAERGVFRVRTDCGRDA